MWIFHVEGQKVVTYFPKEILGFSSLWRPGLFAYILHTNKQTSNQSSQLAIQTLAS